MTRKKLPEMLRRWNCFEDRLQALLAISTNPAEQLEVLGIAIDTVTGRAPYRMAQDKLQDTNTISDSQWDALASHVDNILQLSM